MEGRMDGCDGMGGDDLQVKSSEMEKSRMYLKRTRVAMHALFVALTSLALC